MIRLVTLAGKISAIDPSALDDTDAGLWALARLAEAFPGKTIGQILTDPGVNLSGWWTDFKHGVGDVKDGLGDVLKDTGHAVGETWRGIWNSPAGEIVEDTGRKLLKLEPIDRNLETILSNLGNKVKGIGLGTWIALGGAGLVLLVILARGKK
jgi:hypothetical protein